MRTDIAFFFFNYSFLGEGGNDCGFLFIGYFVDDTLAASFFLTAFFLARSKCMVTRHRVVTVLLGVGLHRSASVTTELLLRNWHSFNKSVCSLVLRTVTCVCTCMYVWHSGVSHCVRPCLRQGLLFAAVHVSSFQGFFYLYLPPWHRDPGIYWRPMQHTCGSCESVSVPCACVADTYWTISLDPIRGVLIKMLFSC